MYHFIVVATDFDRVVIGGGIFGCYAAIVLAEKGYTVMLIEQDEELFNRASKVNQARLHTGLHYPRSLLTAENALKDYKKFRKRFGQAVNDFEQIYGISQFNSKTNGTEFQNFVKRLGIGVQEIDPSIWFNPGKVCNAFLVEEPTFDYQILRDLLTQMIFDNENIRVALNEKVVLGKVNGSEVTLKLESTKVVSANGLIIAAYASTNGLREQLNLKPLELTFELTEIILGQVDQALYQRGFTVMDGPFWSLMPFGKSNKVSLTSVGLTPLKRSVDRARFSCQKEQTNCATFALNDCSVCPSRPESNLVHHKQQMQLFLKHASEFRETERLITVKAIMTSTSIDDARPTVVHKEDGLNIWTVISGKVSSVFDLESELK